MVSGHKPHADVIVFIWAALNISGMFRFLRTIPLTYFILKKRANNTLCLSLAVMSFLESTVLEYLTEDNVKKSMLRHLWQGDKRS